MTISGVETVNDQDVPPHHDGEKEGSESEDPEHRITAALAKEPPNSEVDLLQVLDSELFDSWSPNPSGNQINDESAAGQLDSEEFTRVLADTKFRHDLRRACQWAFTNCRQSTHASWEDLQQEVLMRFGKWLPQYRADAKTRTVFARIAINVLIDAKRRETAQRRYHEEIDLDELQNELVGNNPWRGIEDRIFLKECRNSLSEPEREMLDEYFVEGRSLRQMAMNHGVSAPAISKQLGRIVAKLHERQETGKGVVRKDTGTQKELDTLIAAAA